ncbi:hypothetical protein LPW26_01265 [Rhodopseudomonas sp. HC1]|uniref:hypothetical protein n=1 Tax=Rhodopseudomonas infernalis TaxID=2897386 RepID=UPI001EE8B6AD|nr:hypothetical protein [Rhodopseudomonas infernalis]MCG6203253.1 hypothetical protein [Rhodopseudomonas infernalis]
MRATRAGRRVDPAWSTDADVAELARLVTQPTDLPHTKTPHDAPLVGQDEKEYNLIRNFVNTN